MNKRPLMTALVVAMILALAGCGLGSRSNDKSGAKTTVPTTTSSTTVPKATTTTTTTQPSANKIANQIGKKFPGFAKGQLKIGTNNVVFAGAPEERGTAAFSKRTLKTPAQVGGFLNEKTPVSQAAKQHVVDAIRAEALTRFADSLKAVQDDCQAKVKRINADAKKATTSKAKRKLAAELSAERKTCKADVRRLTTAAEQWANDEVKRAMNGSGYFPIQVTVAARVMGTTYFKDGKVFESGEWRMVGPDDVFWLFLTRDGKIIFGATVRADCGNPNISLVTPIPVNTPPPPSIELPCPHPGDVPNQNGLCRKHPEDDPMRNPQVPQQVKGPGCIPDPMDPRKCLPIGSHPGPATPPVTTPSGCQPACTPPTQPGSTTTTTVHHPTPSTIPTTVTDPPNTTPVTAPSSG